MPFEDSPTAETIAAAVLDLLAPRLDKVERAILGDPAIGHLGLVTRVAAVESVHAGVEATHQGMTETYRAGLSRAHERIDGKADQAAVVKQGDEIHAIAGKVDRLIWLFIGAGLAAGGGTAAIIRLAGG